IGGARSFSPGGYQGTPLDDLLPVSAEPPIEPQQGSLALFLVIDRSGSMDMFTGGGASAGGASKMAMADQAASEAAGLLQPQDTLGVIAFDSAFQWVVPPTKLTSPDVVTSAQASISRIKAGGGTSILPPLEAAFQAAAVVADPRPTLRSLAGDLPALSGYVATTRNDPALTALETERGHPLLAHWQYGLGRVVVWTSEAQQGWGSDWANWPAAAQF